MVGKVARCQKGILGVVSGKKKSKGQQVWVGVSFEGGPWQSKDPVVVADCLEDYLADNSETPEVHLVMADVEPEDELETYRGTIVGVFTNAEDATIYHNEIAAEDPDRTYEVESFAINS